MLSRFHPTSMGEQSFGVAVSPGTTIIEKLAGSGKWNKVEVVHLVINYAPYTVLYLELMGNHDQPIPSLFVEGCIARGRAEY